jgi:hypothetical protein
MYTKNRSEISMVSPFFHVVSPFFHAFPEYGVPAFPGL